MSVDLFLRLFMLTLWLLPACVSAQADTQTSDAIEKPVAAQSKRSGEPSRVRIITQDDRFVLSVDGNPYTVRGAGMGFSRSDAIATLAEAGGNTFRTWEAEHIDAQLEAAQEHGLKVLVGLDTKKEPQGFDYDDAVAVAQQHDELIEFVDRYKAHPAVLGWIIANEPNLVVAGDGRLRVANPAVYDALGKLVDDIHARDPHHPVTFSLAFTPSLKGDVTAALQGAPNVDFLSFQGYGALPAIPAMVQDLELTLPFMITEYGVLGHWEMPSTAWGREIEEPSGVKAAGLVQRMQGSVIDDPTHQLIGDFVFLWGQKQERTPTWYGLFTEAGEKTAAVDEMTRIWTGKWPANRAPSTTSITLNEEAPTASVRLSTGSAVSARVEVVDPDNDELATRWEIREEVALRSAGGHFEAESRVLSIDNARLASRAGSAEIHFDAPQMPGEYRLFSYSSDGEGGVGTANIPFLVEQVR